MMMPRSILGSAAAALFLGLVAPAAREAQQDTPSRKKLDPTAWGSTHIGKGYPEFVRGDECLFCHRNDIGPTWGKNTHGRTIRMREDTPELTALLLSRSPATQFQQDVQYFLGSRHRVRFLKKSGYGKFSISGAQAALSADGKLDSWIEPEGPIWDERRFPERCAGCHATAVDPASKSFQAFGLDCLTCHGDVPLDHTNDTSRVWLSKKRRKDSQPITSLCAQCHLRGGRSRSTGLPYANTFIAGDNLFKDYEVDLAEADNLSLNPGDRHVYRNVRDVVVYGAESPTCITCHQVHGQSSIKHRRALRAPICLDCHYAEGEMKRVKRYIVSSDTCEY